LPILLQESYQMQVSFAAKPGFPVAPISTDDKLIVMLHGVTRHADIVDHGHTYRYGVAAQLLVCGNAGDLAQERQDSGENYRPLYQRLPVAAGQKGS
jgi:hypothetical protein